MSDSGPAFGTLINVKHVLDETELAKSVLARSSNRMRDEILTNTAEYCDPIDLLLLLLVFLFVLLILIVLLLIFVLFFILFYQRVLILLFLGELVGMVKFFYVNLSIGNLFIGFAHFKCAIIL